VFLKIIYQCNVYYCITYKLNYIFLKKKNIQFEWMTANAKKQFIINVENKIWINRKQDLLIAMTV